jgi:nucleoside recognition membrane protein YjiH
VTFSCIETDQVALKFQMSAPLLGNGMPQNMAQQQTQSRQPGMHDLQQMIMVSIFIALTYSMNSANLLPFTACKLFAQKPARAKVSQ